jgi:hypothetical protein
VTTLLTLVEALARDPEAKADYASGPDAYLERHGFGDLSPSEVNEAVLHASDALPPTVAAQVEPEGGLDSVARVEPTAFDEGATSEYEDDLFGHDPGDDGLDDATDPSFADGGEATDSAEDGDDEHGAGAQDQAAAPAGDEGSEDSAAADQHGADGRPDLDTLHDPHDLDDEATGQSGAPRQAAPADQTEAEDQASPGSADAADESPDVEDVEDVEDVVGEAAETSDGLEDSLRGFDPSLTMDDPFSTPLEGPGAEPWYQQTPEPSYDVDVDEPDGDILDDVDDIDLDND